MHEQKIMAMNLTDWQHVREVDLNKINLIFKLAKINRVFKTKTSLKR
jgi:hypothetical protein